MSSSHFIYNEVSHTREEKPKDGPMSGPGFKNNHSSLHLNTALPSLPTFSLPQTQQSFQGRTTTDITESLPILSVEHETRELLTSRNLPLLPMSSEQLSSGRAITEVLLNESTLPSQLLAPIPHSNEPSRLLSSASTPVLSQPSVRNPLLQRTPDPMLRPFAATNPVLESSNADTIRQRASSQRPDSRPFKRQRLMTGTKSITDYFSPSPPPVAIDMLNRPKEVISRNIVHHLRSPAEPEESTTQNPESQIPSIKLFPPFPSSDMQNEDDRPETKRFQAVSVPPEGSMTSAASVALAQPLQLTRIASYVHQTETSDLSHDNPLEKSSTVTQKDTPITLDNPRNPAQEIIVPESPPEIPNIETEPLSPADTEDEPDVDSEFEEYDPYYDAFQTPRRRPIRMVDDAPAPIIPKPRGPELPSSQLHEWDGIYKVMFDRNMRKPYMSKRARVFLSHLGDINFQDYEHEVLHVDFMPHEVEQYKMYQAVPGRTPADCSRFEQDYPDFNLDYTEPRFILIEPRRRFIAASLTRQRFREELGGRHTRSDREVQQIYRLKPCSTFNHASGDVIDFKFSPVNNQFAVCCNTLTNDYNRPGNLLFGDASKETVCTLNGHADLTVGAERYYTVSDIRFSNDGQYLYSGSYDNTVKIWDMKGKQVSCLSGHGRITALSTTHCSDRVLAVASDDGNVYLYDVYNPTKQRRTILKGQNDRLCGSFLVPGEGYFSNWMLAGYEAKDSSPVGALYVYDIPTARMLQRILPGSNSHAAAYFHPSATHFVVGATGPFSGAGLNAKSVVRVFDPRTEKATMEIGIDSTQKDINKVTISPCSFRVTSSGTDGKTFIWDMRLIRPTMDCGPLHVLAHGVTKNVPQMDGQLEDWDTGVSVAEWLPRSDYIMTGASDGFLKLWDTRLGTPLIRDLAEFDSAVSSAAFNCDRDMLGVGEASGRVTFLDWHGALDGQLRKFYLEADTTEGTGDEGIRAARELLASGRVEIREHHGLRSVFAV